MTFKYILPTVALTLSAASIGFAQDSTAKIPIKALGPVEAKATTPISNITNVRALSTGAVFVNDFQQRQLLLFDPTLQTTRIVADTLGTAIPYGQRNIGLLPFVGDSTIIVDPATYALLVLNPRGEIARVMAPPRPADINTLAGLQPGTYAFDTKGRLVYRVNIAQPGGGRGGQFNVQAMAGGAFEMGGGRGGAQGGGGRGGDQGGRGGQPANQGRGGFTPPAQPDSAAIVRADFDTRKVDTVAYIRIPKTSFATTTTNDGGTRLTARINPLPQGDDWALTKDGSIAIIRVLDYRVDYVKEDGTRDLTPKLPFDWKRLTETEKQTLVDSMKGIAARITEQMATQTQGGNFRAVFEPVPPEDLPDYYPPIRQNTSRADADGNLWLLPTTSAQQNVLAMAAQALAGQGGGRGGFPGAGGPPGGADGGRGGRGGAAGAGAAGAAGGAAVAGARGAGAAGAGAAGAGAGAAGARGADSTRAGAAGANPMQALQALAGTFQQAGLVYDIVNRQGELVERVQLPAGRTIVGFGPGGVVYMAVREGRGMVLERARRQ
jgi:hypothetical protein